MTEQFESKLAAVKAAIPKATKGPWRENKGDSFPHWIMSEHVESGAVAFTNTVNENALNDTAYIAAASPDFLSELIRRYEASITAESAAEAWERAFRYVERHGWESELDGIPHYTAPREYRVLAHPVEESTGHVEIPIQSIGFMAPEYAAGLESNGLSIAEDQKKRLGVYTGVVPAPPVVEEAAGKDE